MQAPAVTHEYQTALLQLVRSSEQEIAQGRASTRSTTRRLCPPLGRRFRNRHLYAEPKVRIRLPPAESQAKSMCERVAREVIPHASVCGGCGRCSTCRIRVRGEIHSIDPPGEDELRVLRRIGATSSVRLACQLRPRRAVEVTPLLPPFAHAAAGAALGVRCEATREEVCLCAAKTARSVPQRCQVGG
jgi:ferredoxin